MPVKRRVGKAHRLDDFHREQLRNGPADCLLAGVGYLALVPAAVFAGCSSADRAMILAAMRADWVRHGAALVRDWREVHGKSEAEPWAASQWGTP